MMRSENQNSVVRQFQGQFWLLPYESSGNQSFFFRYYFSVMFSHAFPLAGRFGWTVTLKNLWNKLSVQGGNWLPKILESSEYSSKQAHPSSYAHTLPGWPDRGILILMKCKVLRDMHVWGQSLAQDQCFYNLMVELLPLEKVAWTQVSHWLNPNHEVCF